MAWLFRPVVIDYRLPPTPDNPKGSTRDAHGKRVGKNTPGVVRIERRSKVWWGSWVDAAGKPQKKALSEKKDIARRMLAKLAGDAQLSGAGIRDQFEEHRETPLDDHVEAFRRTLENRRNSADYVNRTINSVRKMLNLLKVTDLAGVENLDPDDVLDVLAEVREVPERPPIPDGVDWFKKAEVAALVGVKPLSLQLMMLRCGVAGEGFGKRRRYSRHVVEVLRSKYGQGISVSTTDHWLTNLKNFTRWLAGYRTGKAKHRAPGDASRRIPFDPLIGLTRQAQTGDVRLERRALAPAELARLIEAAAGGRPFRGLTGADRAILYRVACRTGFRAAELASLTPGSFDLDPAHPTATVKAGYTKNGEEAVQPLPLDLVPALAAYLEGRCRNAPLWPGGWWEAGAEMVRLDLAGAGLPFEDENGQVYDLHALRHQFVSDLARAGVPVKHAMDLARHSDVNLTMKRYAHAERKTLAEDVNRLPAV